jgi:hypothetical protein
LAKGISYVYGNAGRMVPVASTDIFSIMTVYLQKEFERPEMHQRVFQPLLQWFFKHILPYVMAIILVNFFLTVAAVFLVLYFR